MAAYRIISEGDVEAIHEASLRILGETGIELRHPAARELLLDAGALEGNERVLLTPEMVEKALAGCGGPVRTVGRNGVEAVLGTGELNWHNLGGARDVFEPEDETLRPAGIQDVRDATRLLDALEGATTLTPFFTPCDVPGELMSLAMYRHALPHTTKPLHGPGVQTAEEVQFAVEMAEVIGPAAEVLTMSISPVSPLKFPDELVEAMMVIAEKGVPFGPLPSPSGGATAPLSLAGAVAQQNAEVLAGVVLAQVVNPGLPIIYCGRLAMMEPRTGGSVWGGVELGMAAAMTVQVGHKYGFPVNVYGLSTNAHSLDIQSGYERAMNAVLPALTGADELSGIGQMGAGTAGSYAQMVIDNEICGSVRRIVEGVRVDADSLAVEVIAEVMAGAGNFLGTKHTLKYLRSGEVFIPKLAERGAFMEWEKGGKAGAAERAQAEAMRILKEHEVEPLSGAQEKALDEIIESAEKALVRG